MATPYSQQSNYSSVTEDRWLEIEPKIHKLSSEFGMTASLTSYNFRYSNQKSEVTTKKVLGSIRGVVLTALGTNGYTICYPEGLSRVYFYDMFKSTDDEAVLANTIHRQVAALLASENFSSYGSTSPTSLLSNLTNFYTKAPDKPAPTSAVVESLMTVLLQLSGVDPNKPPETTGANSIILNYRLGEFMIKFLQLIYDWKSDIDRMAGKHITEGDLLHQYCDWFRDKETGMTTCTSDVPVSNKEIETINDYVVSQYLSPAYKISNLFYNPPVKGTIFEIIDDSGDTRDSVLGNILNSNTTNTATKILTHAMVGKSTDVDNITKDTITKITNKITASRHDVGQALKSGYEMKTIISRTAGTEMNKYFATFRKLISQATV